MPSARALAPRRPVPVSLKSLSLIHIFAPVEKTIIDRCVRIVYRDYLNDPKPENMPLLEDLYNALRAQDEKEAQYLSLIHIFTRCFPKEGCHDK